ncbi:reverse transcriptase domain-containing protein, partial [Tanacetum coccineum]
MHGVQVQLVMGELRTDSGMLIQVKQGRLSATTAMAQENGDLALNVDNVFQVDDCDDFDSDVDEAPMAQTMFMANLSSTDPVYDEAGPSYDSDILSEVHDHDQYQDAICEHHEKHEMHDDVQPNYVVDSHTGYTSNSNMIPAPMPNPKPSIPYPSRRNDEKRREKANDQTLSDDFPVVSQILGRSFLKSGRALIDVYEGELTLHVGKEAITFNLDQTLRYSSNYDDMTANRIDVIEMACEEYTSECSLISRLIYSGNPTPYYDPIVSTSSPTLTPFGDSDFLLEEVDAFLALEDDPTSPEVDDSYYDSEGDILLLESFLNDDPSPPPNQGNYLPEIRKRTLKICEVLKLINLSLMELRGRTPRILPPHRIPAFFGREVPKNKATSTTSVNSGSGPVNTQHADQDDSDMPELTIFNKPQKGIFDEASYDDEGMVHDFNNLPTEVAVSPIPTLRIHNIHPQSQILGDPKSSVQTRSRVQQHSGAHALEEPKKISKALKDDSWVEAMQEELLQFRLQQVWILVDLPHRAKVIGTKWVYRNKRDERGVVVRNKARLVAQGHRQEEDIDYNEVFAHVARIEAI